MCHTGSTRLIRYALLLAAFYGTDAVYADSPFVLKVEPVAVVSDHIDVRVALSFPPKHVVYVASFLVSSPSKGATLESLRMPPSEKEPDLADPSKQVSVYAHPFESVWRLKVTRPSDVWLRVAYQGCNDTFCFMPETHTFHFDEGSGRFAATKDVPPEKKDEVSWSAGLSVTTGGGYLSAKELLAFLDRAEGITSVAAGNGLASFLGDPVGFFHAHGVALTLLLVLMGGVLLNLTPCVLPMVPINLAIIGAGAGTRGRGFFLGSAYGSGIVLVYGGLGWVILKSGLFFGALQASPWFSLAVALVFAVLTLAMFDVFIIDFARLAPTQNGARGVGVVAAFSAGALSALLAGACVAPVVLAVLLLAGSLVAGGVREAQFLPFVLGLGMALPWPFAGAGLSVLPQPGRWMVRVKQAFGVFMAVLAAYYFYLAGVGFLPVSQSARDGSIEAGDRVAWEKVVEQAKREGKPIFVDFWATWCKNCSAMEHSTFRDVRVKARLEKYVVVKVQSEKPEQEPAKSMLSAFDVRGLPGFIVLK